MLAPLKKSYFKPRQHIKKQRHHFASKGLYSQSYGLSRSHVRLWEVDHKEGWVPKNWCSWTVVLEKNSWDSLRQQGDQTIEMEWKSTLNIHWKDWCWSSNTLATWCKEPTHWERLWCWERLRAGEGGDRGWDGWMASLAQWSWVGANSGR